MVEKLQILWGYKKKGTVLMISEEDFVELWDMWFALEDSFTITERLRQINHKYNLGLVEE